MRRRLRTSSHPSRKQRVCAHASCRYRDPMLYIFHCKLVPYLGMCVAGPIHKAPPLANLQPPLPPTAHVCSCQLQEPSYFQLSLYSARQDSVVPRHALCQYLASSNQNFMLQRQGPASDALPFANLQPPLPQAACVCARQLQLQNKLVLKLLPSPPTTGAANRVPTYPWLRR